MSCTRNTYSIIQVLKKAWTYNSRFYIYVILEPIGLSKPKFSTILDSSAFKKKLGLGIALTCPAQGVPIPSFRYCKINNLVLTSTFSFLCRACWVSKAQIFLNCWIFWFYEKRRNWSCINMPRTGITNTFFQVNFKFGHLIRKNCPNL